MKGLGVENMTVGAEFDDIAIVSLFGLTIKGIWAVVQRRLYCAVGILTCG